ncbi:retrovirus-related Pol polyprotein from transposon 17.6 [Trichonephila clavipes]|nr:retrovirus-related Pol polyprotein from transposon 17.6 [Trichonephila clavipes]
MITNFFIPELNNHDVQELWFQQDGAACHTARATIDLLKDTFGDRLISRFGPVNWPPRSTHPSQDADLALMTDASDFGLGASLNEITSDGFKPLGFFSKKLTPAQTKCSPFDRELLSDFSAIKYFRHMIECRVLMLYTDHKPLTFAFNQKLNKASPRQLGHLDLIFSIHHRY